MPRIQQTNMSSAPAMIKFPFETDKTSEPNDKVMPVMVSAVTTRLAQVQANATVITARPDFAPMAKKAAGFRRVLVAKLDTKIIVPQDQNAEKFGSKGL